MPYTFGSNTLDLDRRELRHNGELRHLEPQVFDLLWFLIRNRDRVVQRDEIFRAVWRGRIVSEAVLSTRINAVRQAIGDDGRRQRLVRTFRRVGFRFVGAVSDETAGHELSLAALNGIAMDRAIPRGDPANEIYSALAYERVVFYSMMGASDKASQDALELQLRQASTKVDATLAHMTEAGVQVASDFKAVWDKFKATRDREAIPAIYMGNIDYARRIASGVQSERLSKMWSIMSSSPLRAQQSPKA